MAEGQKPDVDYGFKFREDEELEFFTELAVHECERWIQVVIFTFLFFCSDYPHLLFVLVNVWW